MKNALLISWLFKALDLTKMVMDIWKQLKLTYFIITINFCFYNITKDHSLGHPGFNALLIGVRGSGLHPDGYGLPETTKMNLFYHTLQILAQQHYQKVLPWDTLGSMPYSWVSRGSVLHPDGHGHAETSKINLFYHTRQLLFLRHSLKVISWDTSGSLPYTWVSTVLDLTQMVMDIWKQLKSTYFIIPNNFFSTTSPKSYSLGHPGVNALLLVVRGSGPCPDGHGIFPHIFCK